MLAKSLLILLALAGTTSVARGQSGGQPAPVPDDQPLAADAQLQSLLADFTVPADPASLPAPDLQAMAHDPARHRGSAFRLVTGPATRVAERAFGTDHLSAWQFASPDIDEPILLLIHEPQGRAAPGDRVGNITIAAVFHKTALARMRRSGPDRAIRLDDADGAMEQRILVFVGANPVYAPVPSDVWRGWSGAVLAIAVALVLLWLARLMLVKRRTLAKPQAAAIAEPEQWNDANLPSEPADALAELHRRAGDTMTHER